MDITKLNFGDYVYTYNARKITNTNKSRALGSIASFPSGNEVGGWYFMSLFTGKDIHKNKWTGLPMGEDILERIK